MSDGVVDVQFVKEWVSILCKIRRKDTYVSPSRNIYEGDSFYMVRSLTRLRDAVKMTISYISPIRFMNSSTPGRLST